MTTTKPFTIPKQLFVRAYELVKAKGGAGGVDEQTLKDFERNLKDNLYKLWNRMSSGTYFPPAVKAVAIPKKTGGERILGVPTVSDRIAQMVVRLQFEPEVEKYFLEDSYGYRPNKSALQAISITRERCWRYDWVLEFDIKGLFDNIPHDLLMKAVNKHTQCGWQRLYIKRWLQAPLQRADGTQEERTRGTPQGGVISPVLSNLYLHYVFDKWMQRNYAEMKWCRYADDGLVHCETEQQAQQLLTALQQRMQTCGLELHPDKTRIVYCKDQRRRKGYPEREFDFLGYTFRARRCKARSSKEIYIRFTPAVSNSALKSMRTKIKKLKLHKRTELTLQQIAEEINPMIMGWINYYGCYRSSALQVLWRYINQKLMKWAKRKYKQLRNSTPKAVKFFVTLSTKKPKLFKHWRAGIVGSFT